MANGTHTADIQALKRCVQPFKGQHVTALFRLVLRCLRTMILVSNEDILSVVSLCTSLLELELNPVLASSNTGRCSSRLSCTRVQTPSAPAQEGCEYGKSDVNMSI